MQERNAMLTFKHTIRLKKFARCITCKSHKRVVFQDVGDATLHDQSCLVDSIGGKGRAGLAICGVSCRVLCIECRVFECRVFRTQKIWWSWGSDDTRYTISPHMHSLIPHMHSLVLWCSWAPLPCDMYCNVPSLVTLCSVVLKSTVQWVVTYNTLLTMKSIVFISYVSLLMQLILPTKSRATEGV